MKDDIKKTMKNIQLILDITVKDMVLLNKEDIKQLLNCITNLQEKYERMKENAEILSNGYNDLEKRNEKAIEYIEENCIDDEFYINLTNKEKNIIKALNILKGE